MQPLAARHEAKSHTHTKHTHCDGPASNNTTLPYRHDTPKDPKNAPRYRTTRALHTGDRHTVSPPNNITRHILSRGRRRQRLPPPSPLLDKNRTPRLQPPKPARYKRNTPMLKGVLPTFPAHNVCVCVIP